VLVDPFLKGTYAVQHNT